MHRSMVAATITAPSVVCLDLSERHHSSGTIFTAEPIMIMWPLMQKHSAVCNESGVKNLAVQLSSTS